MERWNPPEADGMLSDKIHYYLFVSNRLILLYQIILMIMIN